jgi:uroporphyrinogen-III synthase
VSGVRALLILRPEPGASETAARARAMGMEVVVAPLFAIRPLAWDPPDPARFDAILLTSAHGARQAGAGLARYLALPCFAVGAASAAAARTAGFARVTESDGDGDALARAAAGAGIRFALHLHGRDHLPLCAPGVEIAGRAVYAADAAASLPEAARAALAAGALALVHSPRSAALLASLVADRSALRLAAISPAAAEAAGPGWAGIAAARAPNDPALLELAAKLCNIGARSQ